MKQPTYGALADIKTTSTGVGAVISGKAKLDLLRSSIRTYLHALFLFPFIAMSASISGCTSQPPGTSTSSAGNSDSTNVRALDELRTNLRTQSVWDKVHAAEYLIWIGHPEGVYETYKEEESQFINQSPYRIGIWRVLAQSAQSTEERQRYIQNILQVFKDPKSTDRLHAAETLTKLRVPLIEEAPEETAQILEGETSPLFVYTLAGASWGTTKKAKDNFQQLLALTTGDQSTDQIQMQGAYALRHLGGLSDSEWQSLARTAFEEPEESGARIYLLSSAFVLAPESKRSSPVVSNLHAELIKYKNAGSKGARAEMAVALGEKGTAEDVETLRSILNNEDPLNTGKLTSREEIISAPENADVRSAAAYGILRIYSRQKQ